MFLPLLLKLIAPNHRLLLYDKNVCDAQYALGRVKQRSKRVSKERQRMTKRGQGVFRIHLILSFKLNDTDQKVVFLFSAYMAFCAVLRILEDVDTNNMTQMVMGMLTP